MTEISRAAQVANLANEVVSVKDFGAVGDGVTDDTSAIQAALDAGKPVVASKGDYRVTSPLILPNNLDLKMDVNCRIIRDFSDGGTSNVNQSTFRQQDWAVDSSNIKISGGVVTTADSSKEGKHFALYGDDIHIEDIKITEFYGGQGLLIGGNRNRIHNAVVTTSSLEVGTGGIRMIGGDDFVCSDSHVECGDDCFQFVPERDGNTRGDISISNSSYVNCTGRSRYARLYVAVMIGTTSSSMTASITNCVFNNIKGRTGNNGRSVTIKNDASTGKIENISSRDCYIDAQDEGGQNQAIEVTNLSISGVVSNISFIDCIVENSRKSNLYVKAVDKLKLIRGSYGLPRLASNSIEIYGGVDHNISDVEVYANSGHGLLLGNASGVISNATVEDVKVYNVVDGKSGIRLSYSDNTTVRGGVIHPAIGATTDKGVSISADCNSCLLDGVDISRVNGDTISVPSGHLVNNIIGYPRKATDAELNSLSFILNADPVEHYEVFNTTLGYPVYKSGAGAGFVWKDATATTTNTPI